MTKPFALQTTQEQDASLLKLLNMVQNVNLNSLDKTLAAISRVPLNGYMAASARTGYIAERMVRAAREVRLVL